MLVSSQIFSVARQTWSIRMSLLSPLLFSHLLLRRFIRIHFNEARIAKLLFFIKGLSVLVLPLNAALCSSVLTGKIPIGIVYLNFRFIDLPFLTRTILFPFTLLLPLSLKSLIIYFKYHCCLWVMIIFKSLSKFFYCILVIIFFFVECLYISGWLPHLILLLFYLIIHKKLRKIAALDLIWGIPSLNR